MNLYIAPIWCSLPGIGIQRKLVFRLDRPLLLISSLNKLAHGASFRDRWKPADRFRRISTLGSYWIPILAIRCRILWPGIRRIKENMIVLLITLFSCLQSAKIVFFRTSSKLRLNGKTKDNVRLFRNMKVFFNF